MRINNGNMSWYRWSGCGTHGFCNHFLVVDYKNHGSHNSCSFVLILTPSRQVQPTKMSSSSSSVSDSSDDKALTQTTDTTPKVHDRRLRLPIVSMSGGSVMSEAAETRRSLQLCVHVVTICTRFLGKYNHLAFRPWSSK